MRRQRQPRWCRRGLALLCLLALAHSASAQGIFEMLTGGAGATAAPAAAAPAGKAPATATPATTAAPATGTATPAATPATVTPVTTATPATVTPVATATPAATPATVTPVTTATPAATPATTPTTTAAPATGTPAATPATTPTTTATPATATPAGTPATTPITTPVTSATPAAGTPATTPITTPITSATPATGTPSTAAPSFGTLTPIGSAPAAAAPAGPSAATPAVNMTQGADAAPVANVGTADTAVDNLPADNLPPGPPEAWQALQKDCQLVFNVEIRGKYIIPFTSPKAMVIARVLRDRFIRSAALPDFSVGALSTFTYFSYDSPTDSVDALPVDAGATSGGGRRLARSRDLLQLEKSGAELKIVVATSSVRVESEVESFTEGVDSGEMAKAFTLAGIDTENLTMLVMPFTEDLVGPGNNEGSGKGGVKVWLIATIVGVVLLVVPVPMYMLVRWKKQKNREAREFQAAEAEAARQRMQSRMMRPGSKSFSLKPGGGSADIMVRSGSVGGLAGFSSNGRLQSWSSPDRQPYGISRQTSMTSTGSALNTARTGSYMQGAGSMPMRMSTLPGQPRAAYMGSMAPPPGAYEEELEAARTHRSHMQQ